MEEISLNESYQAAVYLRLSKEDEGISFQTYQSESNSIGNQKALILRELESMVNVTLYDFYIDDGFTGVNFERPEFQRMCHDIYEGKVNMVIVKDLSRFGRDYIEAGRYVKKIFPKWNVRFVSVLDHFDSLTATQSEMNLLIPIKNFVNDSYSRDISNKVRSHQEVMRENGLYVGSYVAYGYKKVEGNKNAIEPDEYSANVVKKIFEWKLEGKNPEGIADKLNRLGVLAPSEYKRVMGIHYKSGFQKKLTAQWSAVTITRILKNRIYIGVLEQGKTKKINYKLDKMIAKPESEWNIIENHHQAIISKSDFENVARLLRIDTRKAPRTEKLYVFSGILFCGECGRSMVRRVSKKKKGVSVYYICSSYNKGIGCTRHSILEADIEEIVLSTIRHHIKYTPGIDQVLEWARSREVQGKDLIINDKEILGKKNELSQCKKMETVLREDLLKNIISEEEYIQFKQRYFDKAKRIEEEITALEREKEKIVLNGMVKSNQMQYFTEHKNIAKLDRTIVLSLVEKVIVHEESCMEIVLKYKDPYKESVRM